MKSVVLVALVAFVGLSSHIAHASGEITPNHQVNPPHTFKRLVCFERDTGGLSGLAIVINVPNDRDAEAKVFFKRPNGERSLIATWEVKYIVSPKVYAVFANRYQRMDISRGSEDLFSLNIQLHSGNGQNGIYEAQVESHGLLGFASHRYEKRTHKRAMTCKFQ